MFRIEAVVNNRVVKKNDVKIDNKEQAIRIFIENMKKKYDKMMIFVLDTKTSDFFVYTAARKNKKIYFLKLIKYETLGKTMLKTIIDFDLPLKNGLKY